MPYCDSLYSKYLPSSLIRKIYLECNEYAGYRFTNITIPGVLYGDPPTIHRKVDCKHIQELIINGVRADAKEYPHMVSRQ